MRNQSELGVVPVDQMVGGDGDTPGLSQPITVDEIQDVLMSDEPVEQRRNRLMEMRDDLVARSSGDQGREFEPLLDEVNGAIATLDGPADTFGTREAVGLAPGTGDTDERE